MFTSMNGGGGCKVYDLGTGTSFDIKSKFPNDYSKLTANNFIVTATSIGCGSISGSGTVGYSGGGSDDFSTNASASATITKSYNATSGVLTCSARGSISGKMLSPVTSSTMTTSNQSSSGSGTTRVYLVIGDMKTA